MTHSDLLSCSICDYATGTRGQVFLARVFRGARWRKRQHAAITIQCQWHYRFARLERTRKHARGVLRRFVVRVRAVLAFLRSQARGEMYTQV